MYFYEDNVAQIADPRIKYGPEATGQLRGFGHLSGGSGSGIGIEEPPQGAAEDYIHDGAHLGNLIGFDDEVTGPHINVRNLGYHENPMHPYDPSQKVHDRNLANLVSGD